MGMFDAFIGASDDGSPVDSTPQVAGAYELKLQQLLDLILRERDCLRQLDLEGLQAASGAKDLLVQELSGLDGGGLPNHRLLEQVREANRRNAYLFWAGLNLVRETMGFFGRKAPAPSYGAFGGMIQSRQGGNLLSGRI